MLLSYRALVFTVSHTTSPLPLIDYRINMRPYITVEDRKFFYPFQTNPPKNKLEFVDPNADALTVR